MSREPRQTESETSQEGLRFKTVTLDNDQTVAIIEHPNDRAQWMESNSFVPVER